MWKTFGKVDIIVNNAGITLPACPIEDISSEQWKRVLDIDLMGTIYGTQCVIPIMRKNGGGKIYQHGIHCRTGRRCIYRSNLSGIKGWGDLLCESRCQAGGKTIILLAIV